jgi:hypothetical protein
VVCYCVDVLVVCCLCVVCYCVDVLVVCCLIVVGLPLSQVKTSFAVKMNNNNNRSDPPLWSSGQSSWLQIHRSGFDSLRYQIS